MIADMHACSYQCDNPPCIKRQRDELLARIEALTADARRYRWLRNYSADARMEREVPYVLAGRDFRELDEVLAGERMDAAIDAARHQGPASGR